jgi:hypothetical protein
MNKGCLHDGETEIPIPRNYIPSEKAEKKKIYIPSEKMEFKKSYDRVDRRVHMINSNILYMTSQYLMSAATFSKGFRFRLWLCSTPTEVTALPQ